MGQAPSKVADGMAFQIKTHASISAPPAVVSSILYDFKTYDDWNPFVRKISGDSAVGGKLHVVVTLPGKEASPASFQPEILKFDEEELRWCGVLGSKFIFSGEHYFQMKPVANGTEFVHGESFSGILAPVIKWTIGKDTEEGFNQMNAALKQRAETTSSS